MKRLRFHHSAGLSEGKPAQSLRLSVIARVPERKPWQSHKEKKIRFLSIAHNDKRRDCHAWTL